MIDHEAIAKDLNERKLTQIAIAKKHGCSPATVVRVARAIGFSIGRGTKNWWEFKQSSAELAYLVGVYLTDGTAHNRGFSHATVDAEFAARTEQCLDACAVKRGKTSYRIFTKQSRNVQPMFVVNSYSVIFSSWLRVNCTDKSKIPSFLWDAPIEHKVAFVSAAIDGDGHVTLSGSILIRGKDGWLRQLPEFLHTMGVRSNGVCVDEILPSGIEYLRVSIRRSDFRALNPQLSIPSKQDRLLNARDTRKRKNLKRYPCPLCGSITMVRKVGLCRECYLKSEDFHQHLIDIAPTGNKAANKKRWGHNEAS